ncbi:YfhO family protein [Candidatus Uabimicrobium amorphum]|uniref:Membrane protein 6-pyruvoyl-tetrahydropterin synthase-related domain-containing protein n=1 Tax=Uabimicrobium amorphum TaxID=2596890 RepID=A0A5S9ITY6_UABAM|nr:YfhO family protein [Candidatus Uabimicrobium amorphum]BBM87586.1 hypothetical protein UABAM_05998 [Candidatus Uabimicrobium amorphum]
MTKTLTNFICGVSGVVFLILIFPALQEKTYVLNDLVNFHIPMRMFYQNCLDSGESFLWFSNIFCGYYIHGEGQVGMYHPLHLFLYSFLPLSTAFNIELFIHYPFMFAGTYFLLKKWDIPSHGALFCAFIFTFSGFNLMHIIHINAVAIVGHIPWQLLCIHLVLDSNFHRQKLYALAGIIALTTSQLLLGHPQSVIFSLVVEIFYVLCCFTARRKKYSLFIAIAKIIAVAVAAIQLFPTWDALQHSLRSGSNVSYAAIGSLQWRDLLLVFTPFTPVLPEGIVARHAYGFYSNGHEFALYCGSTTLLLITWLFIRYSHLPKPQKRLVNIFSALIILSILLATGKNSFIYYIYQYIPIIGKLKYPVRYIAITHFSMAILAGIGFVNLLHFSQKNNHIPFVNLWPILIPILISSGFAMWALQLPHNTEYGMSILTGPILLLLSSLLILVTLKLSANGVFVLVILTAFELGFCGISYIQTIPAKTFDELQRNTQLVDTQLYRWEIRGNANLWAAQGLRCVNGYVGLRPNNIIDPKSTKYREMAGVTTSYTPRYQRGSKLNNAQPRIRLVTRSIERQNLKQQLQNIDLATTAIAERLISLDTKTTPGIAKIIAEKNGYAKINIQAPGKQLLIFSERYHQGWNAYVGGEQRHVIKVYGSFIGCVVDAQDKEIEFHFAPQSYYYGKWISAVGILLAFVFLICMNKLFQRPI